MPSRYFRAAFGGLHDRHAIRYADVTAAAPPAAPTPSEAKLREYLGSPDELISGNVGRRVGRRAGAFGMAVLAYDPYLPGDPDGAERVDTLDELLAHADFVSLHARATSENTHLFDAARFARMKPGAHFVNTARE